MVTESSGIDIDGLLEKIQKQYAIQERVNRVVSDIQKGRLTLEENEFAKLINIVIVHNKLKHAESLAHVAVVKGYDFTEEDVISWYDRIYERARNRQNPTVYTQKGRGLSILNQYDISVSKSRVVSWATYAMRARQYRPASLMLVQGNCAGADALDMKTLSKWTRKTAEDYDGNHALTQFVPFLCRRFNSVRHDTEAYIHSRKTLTKSLHEVAVWSVGKDTKTELNMVLRSIREGLSEVTQKRVVGSYKSKLATRAFSITEDIFGLRE